MRTYHRTVSSVGIVIFLLAVGFQWPIQALIAGYVLGAYTILVWRSKAIEWKF